MSELKYTPIEEIPKVRSKCSMRIYQQWQILVGIVQLTVVHTFGQIHAELRKGFNSGKTKSIAYRKEQLLHLAYLLKDNQKRFHDAMREDLGRHAVETDLYASILISDNSNETLH